jgi:hypothetical protein
VPGDDAAHHGDRRTVWNGQRTLTGITVATGDDQTYAGITIAPCDPDSGRATLLAAQVTTRSFMGTIAYRSGGILVDHGWVRILGAGHPRIGGGLVTWNTSLGGRPLDPPIGNALLVGYDALGGFFAINGGEWEGEPGSLYYFPQDTWAWGPMNIGYAAFLEWIMSDRLDLFYEPYRWSGWEREVAEIGPDQALSVYPFLGFREGGPIADRSRRPVPARELWTLGHDVGRQVADLPDGAQVEVRLKQ